MKNKTIYDLKLHESITLENGVTKVIRVPGGWIYTNSWVEYGGLDNTPAVGLSSVFIPYTISHK